MTTIHLTDAQRDTLPSGYIVIDPDEAEGWRILTEPCPTCGGTGKRYFGRLRNSPGCPNPDCVGGRRVITLTATCPRCKGEGSQFAGPNGHATHLVGCPDCNEGGSPYEDGGVVTLGRFTIPALLPVEKHRIGGWQQKTEGESWVYLYDEREATGYLDQLEFGGSIPARAIQFTMLGGLLRRVDLRLDPLPQPGQFIARPEAVDAA